MDNNPFKDKADHLIGNMNLTYKWTDNLFFRYQLNGEQLFNEASTALKIGLPYNLDEHAMARENHCNRN